MGCSNSTAGADNDQKANRPANGRPNVGSSAVDKGTSSSGSTIGLDNSISGGSGPSTIQAAPNKNKGDFRDNYKLGDVLGQGSFSVVRLGKRISDSMRVAVKIVSRKRLKKEDELSLRAEVELLMSLQHPNIVRMFDFYEEPDYFYVVLEFVSGGELFDRIIEKEFYTEGEARDLFTILLNTVKHCHDRGIIHRDIKPENILLASKDNDVDIKLADFGFAVLAGAPAVKKQAGTPGYIAPEIVRGLPHGKPVDCWSLGVVLFMLVGGYPPFYEEGDELKEIFRKIVNAEFEFHPENWEDVSAEAKSLVRGLLTLDPLKRLTVDDALKHPWLQKARSELTVVSLNKNFAVMKASRAAMAQGAAAIAVEAVQAVRQLSGASLGKNMNLNEVAIDVIRKLSGANLNDAVIEAARKKSGANLSSHGGPGNTGSSSSSSSSSSSGSSYSGRRTPSPSTNAYTRSNSSASRNNGSKNSTNPASNPDSNPASKSSVQEQSRPAAAVSESAGVDAGNGVGIAAADGVGTGSTAAAGIQVSRKKSGAGLNLSGFPANSSRSNRSVGNQR